MVEPGYIYLWWARTDAPKLNLSQLSSKLSDDELNRADRFYFTHHRRTFLVSHGMLRSVLGNYLQKPPESLKFLNDAKGKPQLETQIPGRDLFFSLSHSNNMALCGIALNQELGVDVEYIRPLANLEAMAKKYFSESELRSFLDASFNARDRIFFHLWTMKEACLKASGEGLAGLRKIHIAHDDAQKHETYCYVCNNSEKIWTVRSIHLHDQYSAAIAVSGKDMRLPILRQFPDEFI
jgi:4'-phosphopantetheinyl transferase